MRWSLGWFAWFVVAETPFAKELWAAAREAARDYSTAEIEAAIALLDAAAVEDAAPPVDAPPPVGASPPRRVAVVLSGGYSPPATKFRSARDDAALLAAKRALFPVTSRTIVDRVVAPNAADVFVFSWDPGLADLYESTYAPVAARYEDNARADRAPQFRALCELSRGPCVWSLRPESFFSRVPSLATSLVFGGVVTSTPAGTRSRGRSRSRRASR